MVFETPDLARVRKFYVDALSLRVGTFEKDGVSRPDESDSYVNFDLGGVLLGFERGAAAQAGTIVLRVTRLPALLAELSKRGIAPLRQSETFAIIADPDGREIILQVVS